MGERDFPARQHGEGLGVNPVFFHKDTGGEGVGRVARKDRYAGLENRRAVIKLW